MSRNAATVKDFIITYFCWSRPREGEDIWFNELKWTHPMSNEFYYDDDDFV